MNGESYTLVSSQGDTSDYNCLDQCVYHKDGDTEFKKYCFAHGNGEVECQVPFQPTTTAQLTSTTQAISRETIAPCKMGYTKVCSGTMASKRKGMADACPGNLNSRRDAAKECTCLPTRGVEQDLDFGVNPLGRTRQGCVNVEQKMVFGDLEGTL